MSAHAAQGNNVGDKPVSNSGRWWSISSLPYDLGMFAWKQLYYALSRPNKAYGELFLDGNFAPVPRELFNIELEVIDGALPDDLEGAFMRVGPNPALPPVGGYHWFDGDGMVHAVRIGRDGRASYCNRWVETARLRQERDAGWAHCLKLGDYVGLPGLALLLLNKARHRLGLVDGRQGLGTANTALVSHAGRLIALNEGDMPYALRLACDGLLETVGRVSLPGWGAKSFTAHPKMDPETGRLYFFRYTFDAPPYATAGVLSPSGDVECEIPLDLPRPVMMHDMAVTRSFMIFMDHPLCFDGERMVKGQLPFKFCPEHGSRIGLLRKDASDSKGMIWFKMPAFMVFHVANAWEEEDGKVKLFVCYHDTISLDLDTRTSASGGIPPGEQPRLAVVTLDPSSGSSSLRVLSEAVGDFPTIHPRRTGRRSRYAYLASMVTKSRAVKWDGVAKIDLTQGEGEGDARVGRIRLPPGHHNGETVFVPRNEDADGDGDSEDDGYLVTYVHDENLGHSYLGVWDARTMDDAPLARVALPARVPYGFHAMWVGGRALREQMGRGGGVPARSEATAAA